MRAERVRAGVGVDDGRARDVLGEDGVLGAVGGVAEVDEDSQAVEFVDDGVSPGGEAGGALCVRWGWDSGAGAHVGEEGGVEEGVVAVPGEGGGADAEGMVEAEGGEWGGGGDLVEAFD